MLKLLMILLVILRVNSDFNDYSEYEYPFVDDVLITSTKFSSSDPIHYKPEHLILNKHLYNNCATVIYDSILKSLKTDWMLQMLDATANMPSGIHEGNFRAFGHFDECLAIEETVKGIKVLGQYCTEGAHIHMGHQTIKLSVCIPSVCNLTTFFDDSQNLTLNDDLCQTKETQPKWDAADWIMALILTSLLIVIGLSTFYDVFLNRFGANPRHRLLVAFSAYTNGKKLLSTKRDVNYIDCLDGIRFISILWIMVAQTFIAVAVVPLLNHHEATQFKNSHRSVYVHGAHISSCTFFFMSAFLVSYNYFKDITKQATLTFRNLHYLYLHRIIRISPCLIALYLLHVTVLRSFGSGPYWPLYFMWMRDPCIKWWWSFFLFVQNYANPMEMCIPPTWYISADMQLYLLAPFIILPLGYLTRNSSKSIVYSVFAVIFATGVAVPIAIDTHIETYIHFHTHSRLSTYLIGIFMGMFLAEQRFKKFNIPTAWNILTWSTVLLTMFTIVILTQIALTAPNKTKFITYGAVSFPLWSLGLCWIVYSCTVGRGGIVNWLLSRPIFHVMAKLSYAMFLMHNPLKNAYVGYARTTVEFSQYEVIHRWCGDVFFSTILAVIFVLAFEFPACNIEKALLEKDTRKNITPRVDEEQLVA